MCRPWLGSQFGDFAGYFLALVRLSDFHVYLTPALETLEGTPLEIIFKNHISLAFAVSFKIKQPRYLWLHRFAWNAGGVFLIVPSMPLLTHGCI